MAEGQAGVHSVDHFVMAVPDLAEARRFYDQFGLQVLDEASCLHLHTLGHVHRWGTVVEGERKRLPPPPGFEINGLCFRDPNGTLIKIKVAEKSSPDAKSQVSNASPPNTRGMMMRSEAPRVHL